MVSAFRLHVQGLTCDTLSSHMWTFWSFISSSVKTIYVHHSTTVSLSMKALQ